MKNIRQKIQACLDCDRSLKIATSETPEKITDWLERLRCLGKCPECGSKPTMISQVEECPLNRWVGDGQM